MNRIGSYEIREVLGRGGMGTVYRALDPMVNREVALKVINPELSQNNLLMKRFRNEAIAMARLNHPNIVTLYNFFSEGDLHYMVMEYVTGESLSKIISEERGLHWERALSIFTQMVEAIVFAHEQGIIHRDIKPSNVLIQPNGTVKITDFGIAKVLGGEELTRAGATLGTSRYMSPEQIRGEPIGISSDIYSLGVTLYEMVTGSVPFPGNSDFEIQRGHLEFLPPPPQQLNPDIPGEVEAAILKSLEKKPRDRFPSARHFLVALSGWSRPIHEARAEGRAGFSLFQWFRGKGKWPIAFNPWIICYQNLSEKEKWVVLLVGLIVVVLLLIILFSIS